ncbi:hypothetical protein, partial [Virgisporangium aurantiacum]|uniref:hypothetical protein n=1 Tax=Virgisporangium aurantiacum TaxID=175570 RepID=UPI00194E00C2
LCEVLFDASLISEMRHDPSTIRIHEVFRQHLRTLAGAERLRSLNEALVEAARSLLGSADWWNLPPRHTYLWTNLVHHLMAAGRSAEAEQLVSDLRWASGRLQRGGAAALEADLTQVNTPVARALATVVRRNAHLFEPIQPADALGDILADRLEIVPELAGLAHQFYIRTPRPRLLNRWRPSDESHQALRRTLTMPDASQAIGIACGAGGALLATRTAGGQVHVWDMETGIRRQSFGSDRYGQMSMAFAPDGRWIATARSVTERDPVVCVWDVDSGELRQELVTEHRKGIWELKMLAGGDRIATVGRVDEDPMVQVWETRTWTTLWTLNASPDHRKPQTVIAPDGTWIATVQGTSGRGNTIGVRNSPAGALPRSVELDAGQSIRRMAVTPDGRWLAVAVAGREGCLRVWDTETWTLRNVETPQPYVYDKLIAPPDGAWIATTRLGTPDDARVDIWDGTTWAPLRSIDTGHPRGAGLFAVSPDGRWLATAEYDFDYDYRRDAGDGVVRLWDVAAGELLGTIGTGHRSGVGTLLFTPDSRHIITGGFRLFVDGGDALVRVWAVEAALATEAASEQGRLDEALTMASAPNGDWLAVGASDGSVRILDSATGLPRATFDTHRRIGNPLVYVDPAGTWIATHGHVEDKTVQIWEFDTGAQRLSLDVGDRAVFIRSLAIAPDGSWLAALVFTAIPPPDNVRLWNTATGRQLLSVDTGHPHGVRQIAVDPGGGWFATVGQGVNDSRHQARVDRTVRIWDVTTGAPQLTIDSAHPRGVRQIAVGPGGRFATIGDVPYDTYDSSPRDPILRVWDATAATECMALDTGCHQGLDQVLISPRGDWIATLGSDLGGQRVVLWHPDAGHRRTLETGSRSDFGRLVADPTGRWLSFWSSDGKFRVWTADGEPHSAMRVNATIYEAAAIPGGDGLYLSSNRGLYRFDRSG